MSIKFPIKLRRKEEPKQFPLSFSVGMLMNVQKIRPVYLLILSIISLLALAGSFFTFISACRTKDIFLFDEKNAGTAIIAGWAFFSLIYGLNDVKPALSKALSALSGGIILLFCAANINRILYGIKYTANCFMGTLYSKFAQTPIYELTAFYETAEGSRVSPEECADFALSCMIIVCAFVICRTVRSPNLLLFICASFPLPELCLYFGLVPDYSAFVALVIAWCGAAAAEITRLNMFTDRDSERVFTKTGAQSAAAAAFIMLISFIGAELYIEVTDFRRPASVDNFRTDFAVYSRNLTWDKLKKDISDTVDPTKSKKLTHDGKLGNVDSIEFSGSNMLEVTLPSDASTLYLKGFTGTEYTGSRWEKGISVPPLETNLTSPEFFSARVMKAFPDFSSLPAMDVIVRNVNISSHVKYYPSNAAGLLETDGTRRRYGVYFPKRSDWQSVILNYSEYLTLGGTLAEDINRIEAYAYEHCLDVPESFTAADEFFSDFGGGDTEDTLKFIRNKLARTCSYNLESGKKPFASDFAQWFLTENKAGSCTHFASAAVLLCRSRGIPARYCEGFIIKPEDIAGFRSVDGYTTVSVPDSRAHAWAEVYIENYGWLIFESTPGYGNIALDTSGNDDWEKAPGSEITSVTTEAPAFTETLTEYGTEMTEVSISVSEQTAEPTEYTDTAAIGSGDAGLDYTEIISADGNSVNAGNGSGGGTGNADNTVAASSPAEGTEPTEGTGPSSQTLPDDNGSDITSPPREFPAALRGILIFFGTAAVGGITLIIRRGAVLSARRKCLTANPRKAAGQMYRLLLKAGGAGNDPETAAEQLAHFGIERECADIIISTAERARFGKGIDRKDAARSAEALAAALECIREAKSSSAMFISWIRITDRYI